MTLDEFTKLKHREADRFAENWRLSNKHDAKYWALEMTLLQWHGVYYANSLKDPEVLE